MSDGLSGAEDVYLYLLFGYSHYRRYLFITLAFKLSQVHCTSLFLRQLTYQSAYQLNSVSLHYLFLRVRGVALVGRIILAFFKALVLVFQLAHPVE